MREPVTVAFICLKGGVGKTTTAVHCAQAWARRLGVGAVQLIDSDPQQNAAVFLEEMPQVLAADNESVRVWIIDTPPTAGDALNEALLCARHVIVPVSSFGALQGVAALAQTVAAQRGHNPTLQTHYVLTMQHPTARSSRLLENAVRARFGAQVLAATIRRSDAFESAWICGQTVFDYAPKSRAAVQMQTLCDELFARLKIGE